jgi:hypothetical protein
MRIALVLLALATVAKAAGPDECAADRKRAAALRQVLASVGDTTAEYRALLLKHIQEADTAAIDCERAIVAQRRAEEARLAARKREAEAAAKKDAADRFAMDDMKSRPSFIREVWSAYECSFEKERDEVLANPFATAEQREQLKRAEAMLLRIHGVMKRGKLTQLPCRADAVAKLAFCIADKAATPACAEPGMSLAMRAEQEVIASVQVAPSVAPLSPAEKHAREDEDDMHVMAPQF